MPDEGLVSRPMAPVRPASAGGGLVIMNAQAIVERVKVIHEILEQVMIEGVHYHSFGTTKRKVRDEQTGNVVEKEFPQFSLGKAGAELLNLTFGLTPDLSSEAILDDPTVRRKIQVSAWVDDPVARGGRRRVIQEQEIIGYYEVKSTCAIWSTSGTLLARASGTCNSAEAAFYNQLYSNVKNSVLKRAEKRAMVAAVLMATGAGDMFTQDLEDLPPNADGSGVFSGQPGAAGTQTGGAAAGTAGGAQQGSKAAWPTEPMRKLIFAKGKNQVPPVESAVVDHIISSLEAMGEAKGKPIFRTIADEKPEAAKYWAQARETVEARAHGNPAGAGTPPPAEGAKGEKA